MRFDSILKKYLLIGRTGQIVVKFAGEKHLCKIYIEDGKAVYISMGSRKPHDTLSYIKGKEPEEANFIKGVMPLKRLDEPLNDKLLALEGNEEAGQTLDDVLMNPQGIAPPEKVDILLDSFIDIVGPLGIIFAERIFSNLRYRRGTEMSREDYSVLFSTLIDDVPENRREEFKNRNRR